MPSDNSAEYGPRPLDLEHARTRRGSTTAFSAARTTPRPTGRWRRNSPPWPRTGRCGARLNRSFLRHAVQFMTDQGIDQFLDLGSGIPTVGNVHEIAQQANPDARVVYVDYEPVAYGAAHDMLADNPNATILHADLREPDVVLNHPDTRELLDFSRPVGLLIVGVLLFLSPQDRPAEVVAAYRDRLVPGSFLAHLAGQPGERHAGHLRRDRPGGRYLPQRQRAVDTAEQGGDRKLVRGHRPRRTRPGALPGLALRRRAAHRARAGLPLRIRRRRPQALVVSSIGRRITSRREPGREKRTRPSTVTCLRRSSVRTEPQTVRASAAMDPPTVQRRRWSIDLVVRRCHLDDSSLTHPPMSPGRAGSSWGMTTASTLRVPDADLHYELRGSGPLVVLVGAPMDARPFTGLAELLATDHLVLTTDPRGINRSKLDDPRPTPPSTCAPTTWPDSSATSTRARPSYSAPAVARSACWPSPRPTRTWCTP